MRTQKSRILEAAHSLVASANEGQTPLRQVRPQTVTTIVNRSLARTESLPFSLREHLALRDVSDFVSLSQSNKSLLRKSRNTDLLPVGHPSSTRKHMLSLDSLFAYRSRWIASDPKIKTDEARALVAAAYSALPDSAEHMYFVARIRSLPEGVIPQDVLIASVFGGGNSRAARSARARAQRRDKKGRFAWMGGGLSAFVRMRDGSVRRLSGRLVAQGGGSDNTFDIETTDGDLYRVEAAASEGTKAFLPSSDAVNGFSPATSDVKTGEYVMDESALRRVEAPNGFYRDATYKGPGIRYTDDAYEVIKLDPKDGAQRDMVPGYLLRRAPGEQPLLDENKPVYVVRRNGSSDTETGYQSWAETQDWIRKDEIALDKEEGRQPDLLARLTDEQYDSLVDNVGDGDPYEYARGILGDTADQEVKPEKDQVADEGQFRYKLPEGAYEVSLYEEFVPGENPDAESEYYTEDPGELAGLFDADQLRDALYEAVMPSDGNDATGRGTLEFYDGISDTVPAEALYSALSAYGQQEAEYDLADMYDSELDSPLNRDALDEWYASEEEGGEGKAVSPSEVAADDVISKVSQESEKVPGFNDGVVVTPKGKIVPNVEATDGDTDGDPLGDSNPDGVPNTSEKTTEEDLYLYENAEFPPTMEQQDIIDAVMTGEDVVVRALAGTGKTSTLKMIAQRILDTDPAKKILYIAFNKSVQEDAQRAMPSNVTAKTSHALAMSQLSQKMRRRIDFVGGRREPDLISKNSDIARTFGIQAMELDGDQKSQDQVVAVVKKAINNYAISADNEISEIHFPIDDVPPQLLNIAREMWRDISNENGKLVITGDDAIKIWAISRPNLKQQIGADIVFFDEAQDINPVLAKIVADQNIQKIYVGDENQAIYAFRGAEDQLQQVNVAHDLPLTKSWRFGSQIAEFANKFLDALGARHRVEGGGPDGEILPAGTMTDADAVLTRTNAGAITAIMEELARGRRVGVSEAYKRELQSLIETAEWLMNGGDPRRKPRSIHPDLAEFRNWDEVTKAAQDRELNRKVAMLHSMVEENGINTLRDVVNRSVAVRAQRGAADNVDVIVSTAHKSKGLEWDNVRIANDFWGPRRDPQTGKVIPPSPEEIRLAYVAVTRAQKKLDPGSLSWILTYKPEGAAQAVLPEETPVRDLPPLLDGLSDEERSAVAETGNYKPYLPKNEVIDAPEGFYSPDPEPFENVEEDPNIDPLNLSMNTETEDLTGVLVEAISPDAQVPGIGILDKPTPDGDVEGISVPAESARDALQLQGEDTNKIIADTFAGNPPTPQPVSTGTTEEASQEDRNAGADLAAELLYSEEIQDLIRSGAGYQEIIDALNSYQEEFMDGIFVRPYLDDLNDYETRMFVDLPDRVKREKWERFGKFQDILEKIKNESADKQQEVVKEAKPSNYFRSPDEKTPNKKEQFDQKYVDFLLDAELSDLTDQQLQDLVSVLDQVPDKKQRFVRRARRDAMAEIARRERENTPEVADKFVGEEIVSSEEAAPEPEPAAPSAEEEKAVSDIVPEEPAEEPQPAEEVNLDVRAQAERWQPSRVLQPEEINGYNRDVVFGDDGKTYRIEARLREDGRFNIVIIDNLGNEARVGIRREPRAARNAVEDYAWQIEAGDFAGVNMQNWMAARPAAESVVNPEEMQGVEPPVEGEQSQDRMVREGRNADRLAANGRDDAAPEIEWLNNLRRGRARMPRMVTQARDQLKRLIAGWDSRGHRQNRPEHRIEPRVPDPNVAGPGGVGEEIYADVNGNIVREGDIITHRRVGSLVNPNREAVNIVRARVIGRGKIWRNGKWNYGYLQVEILESDDPEWVGRKDFLYRANMTEVIEQPDLRDRIEAEDAARTIPETEQLKMDLWRMTDEEVFQNYLDIYNEVGGARNYNNQRGLWRDQRLATISAELEARNLVDPGRLAMVLDSINDDALAKIDENIGAGEGVHGQVFRALLQNERDRRNAGQEGPLTELPDMGIDAQAGRQRVQQQRNRRQQQRPAPAQPAPQPAQAPPAAPAPQQQQPPSPPTAPGALPPIDPRTVVERFIGREEAQVVPERGAARDASIAGLVDPQFGTVHDMAANPDAVQKDYTDIGYDEKRAAEIAEAARSRPSLKSIQEMYQEYLSAVEDGRTAEANATYQNIAELLRQVWGLDDILLGKEEIRITGNARGGDITFGEEDEYPFENVTFFMDGVLRDEDNKMRGTIQRRIVLNLEDPSESFAYNELFMARDASGQSNGGSGVSDPYNRWMENWYAANGINKVKVHAAGGGMWTGAARWALNNFQWDETAGGVKSFIDFLDDEASIRYRTPESRETLNKIKRQIQRLRDRYNAANGDVSKMPTPMHFALVGADPGDTKDWFGWSAMIRRGWHGVKYLLPKSVSQKERVGYEDYWRTARSRVRDGKNPFEASNELSSAMSREDFYAEADNIDLAPYRDEYMSFFGISGGASLARLSPPARQALAGWVGRSLNIRNNPYATTEDLVSLTRKLRDEDSAYDTTPKNITSDPTVIKRITFSDVVDSLRNVPAGDSAKLLIRGQETKFNIRRLPGGESGVMETYMITDTESGQVIFAKYSGSEPYVTENEVNVNVLARALGMRGASYVSHSDDGKFTITTFAGTGIRDSVDVNRASEFLGRRGINVSSNSYLSNLSIADLVDAAILDAVSANGDRHNGNYILAELDTSEAPNGVRYVPIAIDHGYSALNMIAQNPNPASYRDPVATLINNNIYSKFITAFGERMAKLSKEKRTALVRAAAQDALDRMQNMRSEIYGGDNIYNALVLRLERLAQITEADWR